ncbi:MAG: tRNA pseudouridine(38-40) synthase TruA [Muribaculaceae bacterium]|nr:tRNA pseudouridine(38-40) synthase TruA [Muribaculaceae bacterium]MDE6196278.1 tRNA pseudouridine(38-40) synthase TruA [Muribaculaceae bacterium]
MRWFMTLSYLGAPFHGWQRQPGEVTVQSTIEDAMATVLRTPVPITGAGRTDAGVNARRMVAHVDLPDGFDPREQRFMRAVNSIAGPHIAIESFEPVAADAHARFDATERSYRYFVHTAKWPFAAGLSWYVPNGLDFDAMNEAAALMLGRRDFTSFSKLHTDVKTNICDLRRARWHAIEGDGGRYYFEIAADRFLRNMVRAVVGTLAEVGRGKMRPEGIIDVLERKDRCAAGTSVPGEALFLWDVKY